VKAAHVMKILLVLAGFATFAIPRGFAQSEIDPDHFDSPNTEPFLQSKTKADVGAEIGKVRFSGKFNLPYSVQCAGKRLQPGNYLLALRSDGKTGWVTLNQKGQAIGISGLVHNQAHKPANHALIIEHDGKMRRLSVIQVAELELVLDPNRQIERSSRNRLRRIEKLPLVLVDGRK
jgi:hypothetical protein